MEFAKYDPAKAAVQGKIDGRGWRLTIYPWFVEEFGPIPAPGSAEVPPYVRQMKSAAEAQVRALCEQWARVDGSYRNDGSAVLVRLAGATEARDNDAALELRVDYVRLREQREAAWWEFVQKAEAVADRFAVLFQAYKAHNLRHRPPGEGSAPVLEQPEVEIPDVLRERVHLVDLLGYSDDDLRALGVPPAGE